MLRAGSDPKHAQDQFVFTCLNNPDDRSLFLSLDAKLEDFVKDQWCAAAEWQRSAFDVDGGVSHSNSVCGFSQQQLALEGLVPKEVKMVRHLAKSFRYARCLLRKPAAIPCRGERYSLVDSSLAHCLARCSCQVLWGAVRSVGIWAAAWLGVSYLAHRSDCGSATVLCVAQCGLLRALC
jgi:hypothetical protein